MKIETSDKTVVVEGLHFQTGLPIRLSIADGTIIDLQDLQVNDHSHLPYLAPGLVDLQLNGFAGNDFNSPPLAVGLVEETTRRLLQEGNTTYYPTVITNHDRAIVEAVSGISRACSQDRLTAECIAGIHLEGPFISPEDGARGAHDRAFVMAPDWPLFERWQEAAQGRIKIVTLSPEWPESVDFIEQCVRHGVMVSIGHTSATPKQIQEAVSAGASMSTHLGNGAHLQLPRHPNYIWEQLAQDELWSCMIADGFHLPDSVLKVILKVKSTKALLVSDAVYLTGCKPGEYETHIGGKVLLTPEGRLSLAENPKLLAGSAQLLTWGIRHLVQRGICSLATAWQMASMGPSQAMNLAVKRGIAIGAPADLVSFHWNQGQIEIIQTYKNGKEMKIDERN